MSDLTSILRNATEALEGIRNSPLDDIVRIACHPDTADEIRETFGEAIRDGLNRPLGTIDLVTRSAVPKHLAWCLDVNGMAIGVVHFGDGKLYLLDVDRNKRMGVKGV